MIKFGKPIADILDHKISFFKNNKVNLDASISMFDFYIQQPFRKHCKNCLEILGPPAFKKNKVDYILCTKCKHLNGAHQDTDAFCSKIYTEDSGDAYATNYSSDSIVNYRKRVNDIYAPKADFLLESLKELKIKPDHLKYADLGAGSGYFIYALKEKKLQNVVGFEVSTRQVELANSMCGKNTVIKHELSDIVEIIEALNTEVVSMIGVLEHVQNPRDILAAIQRNSKIHYFFLSLPLFSPSVFFETIVADYVSPRHLAPPHTHLYTESSINYFCKEFGFSRKSEWWFGTDMMDLYRSIWVSLKEKGNHQFSSELWDIMFMPLIDKIQLSQDELKASSEVHLLLKKI